MKISKFYQAGQSSTKPICFVCVPERETYNNGTYKMYSCAVDFKKYPSVKESAYKGVTIKGEFGDLITDRKYEVVATEAYDNRYKWSYIVQYIQPFKERTTEEVKTFLSSFISERQADALLSVYPDIVDRIIDKDPVDLSLVHGIKESTFTRIEQKVVSNFTIFGAITEFADIFNIKFMTKLLDQYVSAARIKEELLTNPYKCLMSVHGVGYKTADKILSEKHEKISKILNDFHFKEIQNSYKRLSACIEYLLEENETSGNTIMSLEDLRCKCKDNCLEAIGYFNEVYSDDKYVIIDNAYIERKTTFVTEQNIAQRLLAGRVNSNEWNISVEPYRETNGIKLTDEQISLLRLVQNNNIITLIGNAGVGKSFLVKSLIKMLEDNQKTYRCLTPTGRAAKVLSGYTGVNAETIHRALGYKGYWSSDVTQLCSDVIIVDEASMVDLETFYHLLLAIDFKHSKLLLIGDDAQIPSVGCGNVLHDVVCSNIFASVKLTKVFRYGSGGLATVATDIRKGRKFINGATKNKIIGTDKTYGFIPVSDSNLVKSTVDMYCQLISGGYSMDDICVLSAYNIGSYGTQELNKRIQEAVNTSNEEIVVNKTKYKIGDPVINKKNNYEAEEFNSDFKYIGNTFIANGEIGKIIQVNHRDVMVDFSGRIIKCGDFNNLLLAYSISCHSSQGGQFKVVILVTPKSHCYFLNANLMYVGVTRAMERCFHLGNSWVVDHAVTKHDDMKRITMLEKMLSNNINEYEAV